MNRIFLFIIISVFLFVGCSGEYSFEESIFREDLIIEKVNFDTYDGKNLDLFGISDMGIISGKNLYVGVRIRNATKIFEKSAKVIISIPDLNINNSNYVHNSDSREIVWSDDIQLFIPKNILSGEYVINVMIISDDQKNLASENFILNIINSSLVIDSDLLINFEDNQELIVGENNIFKINFANPSFEEKLISLNPINNSWFDVNIDPNSTIIKGNGFVTFNVSVNFEKNDGFDKKLFILVKENSQIINELKINTKIVDKK